MKELAHRQIKKGEALAILPEAIHAGPKGMFWDYYQRIPDNERCGNVAVVYVRGSLEHHADYGCDSYERLLERVRCALSGEDVVADARRRAYWDDDVVVPEPAPPRAVILRIDSPGGVVSGLNQTVFALRKMGKAAGIPLVAYVDELAASAAYALACACDEILLPPSAIAGSVGVISMMADQTEADKRMGLKVVTITSGARKADGHPHVPITDEAVAAEKRRVMRLAKQFYALVAAVRPLSTKEIAALQAGIFLGKEAVAAGLADAVMSWEDTLASLEQEKNSDDRPGKGSSSHQQAPSVPNPDNATRTESRMSLVALKALVKRTKAELAESTDSKRKKQLTAALSTYEASLEAYKRVKHTKEVHEAEEGEEDDEDEEESEESEEKGNETDRKEGDEPPPSDDDSDEDDDEDEDDEESEEEEKMSKKASAALNLIESATGMKGSRALGAARALIESARKASADVAAMKREALATKKATLIREATGKYLTKAEAKYLAGQKLAVVEGFVQMRRKSGVIVHVDDETLIVPKDAAPGTEASLPKEVLEMIDAACAACPPNMKREDFRKQLVDAHLADHKKRLNAANGAAGRI